MNTDAPSRSRLARYVRALASRARQQAITNQSAETLPYGRGSQDVTSRAREQATTDQRAKTLPHGRGSQDVTSRAREQAMPHRMWGRRSRIFHSFSRVPARDGCGSRI